jgi:hypothetical protein
MKAVIKGLASTIRVSTSRGRGGRRDHAYPLESQMNFEICDPKTMVGNFQNVLSLG